MTKRQYALLGSGRLAAHLKFYLSHFDVSVIYWSRDGSPEFNTYHDTSAENRLKKILTASTHVLLATSDSSLKALSERTLSTHVTTHFSGATHIDGVYAAHPLMTFGRQLENFEFYKKIPLIVEDSRKFDQFLPPLPNPKFEINATVKPLYHALCSLGGNSVYLLWREIADTFESRLNLPREVLLPFFQQIAINSVGREDNFTGPVARGDWQTIRTHLQSLEERPELFSQYQNFLQRAIRGRDYEHS